MNLLPHVVMPAVFPGDPKPVVDTLHGILAQPTVTEDEMRMHLLKHGSALLVLVRRCQLSTGGLTMFLQTHIDQLADKEQYRGQLGPLERIAPKRTARNRGGTAT